MNMNRNMGATQSAKNLSYSYYAGTNRLRNTDGSSSNKYQYDAAGNVITNSERNINSITYDHRNLAQRIETDGSGTHRYIYDHTGSRIGKQYKPHGATNWSVNTRYIYGAFGEMLAQYDGASPQYWNILAGGETIGRRHAGRVIRGQERAYYLKDHLGSVRVTVTEDGTVLGWDDYYPFGLQMDGRSSNSANTHDDMKFTGHFLEQEGNLGIYHARARMYDPATGRFWGVDAMRSAMPGWNTYHYTFNNPVRFVDPDGNAPDNYYKIEDGTTLRYVGNDGTGNATRLVNEGESVVVGDNVSDRDRSNNHANSKVVTFNESQILKEFQALHDRTIDTGKQQSLLITLDPASASVNAEAGGEQGAAGIGANGEKQYNSLENFTGGAFTSDFARLVLGEAHSHKNTGNNAPGFSSTDAQAARVAPFATFAVDSFNTPRGGEAKIHQTIPGVNPGSNPVGTTQIGQFGIKSFKYTAGRNN